MAIKVLDEYPYQDIWLTKSEYEKYKREHDNLCRFTTEPMTLEDYIRKQLLKKGTL